MLRTASCAAKAATKPHLLLSSHSSASRLLSTTALRMSTDDSSKPTPRTFPSTSSSSSTTTTNPVSISYNPPNKGTASGGSITLNLPPHLVQAISRKPPGTPTKTSSARAKAQASKALRQTLPEPTTGQVYAWATAHSYSFSELVKSGRLPGNYQIFQDNEVIYIPHWPISSSSNKGLKDENAMKAGEGRGEVFIFRSGSYVTWGLDQEQSQRFLRNVIQPRDLQFQVQVGTFSQPGDEVMDYLYASSQLTRVQGDIIVIGQPPKTFDAETETCSDDANSVQEPPPTSTPSDSTESSAQNTTFGTEWTPLLARLAFSQGLARSARLSVQESSLSSFLSTISTIPLQLESSGSVPLSRTSTIKHMGTLLRLRQTANLDRDNFYDEPEVYWENAKLEDHYRSICANLDIGQRFETLNEKLDHCENLLGVVRALLTEKTTHRMELIIIGLIAFEAGMALVGHGWLPTADDFRAWLSDGKEFFAGKKAEVESESESELETTT